MRNVPRALRLRSLPFSTGWLPGSERFEQRITEDKKAELEDSRQRAHKENSESHGRIRTFLGALERAAKSLSGAKYPQGVRTFQANRKKPTVPVDSKVAPTRAQKGEVDPPAPILVRSYKDNSEAQLTALHLNAEAAL
ncbi:hypothetical protein EVAR_94580_1 [Eumeta japonica]|uniref:Uncharacterized protein n=1 Tax=Eumeta variegata TaxID=151549 RepID=A0A4C1UUS7_EUMVA|nr:hypothetical protein EVAR_94580_1 [Eumeta japonica]